MPSFTRDEILAAGTPLARQRRTVRFQDVDAAGTIFFPQVFEYFSDAYLELLLEAGIDVPGSLARREAAAPVVHAEADYLAPLRFGDEVEVEVALARLGETSTRFAHRIRTPDGRVATVGQTVHVWVDGTTFRPIPVPTPLRHHLAGRPGVRISG